MSLHFFRDGFGAGLRPSTACLGRGVLANPDRRLWVPVEATAAPVFPRGEVGRLGFALDSPQRRAESPRDCRRLCEVQQISTAGSNFTLAKLGGSRLLSIRPSGISGGDLYRDV